MNAYLAKMAQNVTWTNDHCEYVMGVTGLHPFSQAACLEKLGRWPYLQNPRESGVYFSTDLWLSAMANTEVITALPFIASVCTYKI